MIRLLRAATPSISRTLDRDLRTHPCRIDSADAHKRNSALWSSLARGIRPAPLHILDMLLTLVYSLLFIALFLSYFFDFLDRLRCFRRRFIGGRCGLTLFKNSFVGQLDLRSIDARFRRRQRDLMLSD